ncbi:glycosyltransferase [Sporosarcina sp. 179-K 3D1 HS]|uniref:glycosyltransferase n=1 Tax=Sporosarcina sp. 179-K 3D1 HS TaxID=3232169 RepID=UPI00399FF294
MRVLHIIPTLESGGAEKMLVDIAEEMKDAGVSVEILVLSRNHDFYGEKLKELNIPTHYSPVDRVYHPLQMFQVAKHLKRKFDVVHAHLFAPQLYTACMKGLTGRRTAYITTEHNTYNRRREKRYFKLLDRWMYHQYAKIIANTEGTKEELVRYLPGTARKTVVVHNGIYLKRYRDAEPLPRYTLAPTYREKDKLVVMVAAMREQKDYETVIRASKLLPDHYHILFVGTGERCAEVMAYAKEHGSRNIHFLGRRDDVPSILKSCDIFVLSSHWEGFGLVAVEAMAAGLPVVVSDVPGLRDVVDGAGFLFKGGDEEDLTEKMLDVSLKPATAQHERARHVQLARFSIEQMVARYLELYKEETSGRL